MRLRVRCAISRHRLGPCCQHFSAPLPDPLTRHPYPTRLHGRWPPNDLDSIGISSISAIRKLCRELCHELCRQGSRQRPCHAGAGGPDVLRTRPRRSGYLGGIARLMTEEARPRSDGKPWRRVREAAGGPSYAEGKPIQRPAMEIPFSATVDENGDESGVRWGPRHSLSVIVAPYRQPMPVAE